MRNILALIATVLICAVPAPAADEQPVYVAVPVVAAVRGWGDLLAQPVIDLGGGVRVRLGLESATGAASSSMLLYCLAEGFTAPNSGSGEDHLGPVRISLAVDGVWEQKTQNVWSRQISESRQDARDLPLFARMIPIAKPATYAVAITNAGGKLLATASVVVTTVDPNPWGSLGTSRFLRAPERAPAEPGAKSSALVSFGFVGSFPAIPTCDGLQALAWYQPNQGDQVHQPLPRLLPATPDPRLKLSWRGGRLVLDSELPLMICGGYLPILMRWWVNDRQLVPSSATRQKFNGGAIVEVHQVVLDGDLDPAVLGAKSGDRIGVQLLYCPYGWGPSDLKMQQLLQPVTALTNLPLTLLSNRVDFPLP